MIMERLQYEISIAAPAAKVWRTMLEKETYLQWTANAWPGSTFQGEWKEGEQIRFVGADGSGTLAEIEEIKPFEKIFARHVAVLLPGGKEDRTSDAAKGWGGTIEAYSFKEEGGNTKVTVIIETAPEWRQMFDDTWPSALEDLRKIIERQPASV